MHRLLLNHTEPLRHVTGFPDLGLLWALRPLPTASVGDGPSRPARAGCPEPAGPPAGFPRSLLTVRRDRYPAMPLHHRHGYAAGLHHGLLARRHPPDHEFPAPLIGNPTEVEPRVIGAVTRCDPAHVRQVPGWWVHSRGVQTLVPHVCLSVVLAEPAPSGSTGTPRRCQGRCPPSLPSRGSGCPQLHHAAATARRWWSLTTHSVHNASWRAISVSQTMLGAVGGDVTVDQIQCPGSVGIRSGSEHRPRYRPGPARRRQDGPRPGTLVEESPVLREPTTKRTRLLVAGDRGPSPCCGVPGPGCAPTMMDPSHH